MRRHDEEALDQVLETAPDLELLNDWIRDEARPHGVVRILRTAMMERMLKRRLDDAQIMHPVNDGATFPATLMGVAVNEVRNCHDSGEHANLPYQYAHCRWFVIFAMVGICRLVGAHTQSSGVEEKSQTQNG